jgi:haloalkane dehalogenase
MIAMPDPLAVSRRGFEDEYPFRSRFLTVDGSRYHYIDEGDGEPLLMVHGNPTWSFAWRNVVKGLSGEYRALAVDHIGCGMSEKPPFYEYRLRRHVANLARFVTELDLRGITLVAHDWGGLIGMGAAVRLPERFRRFVLLNTAAFKGPVPRRIAACRWPVLGPLAVRGLNVFARSALSMCVSKPERLTPAVRRGYLAPYDSWANRQAVLRFVQDIPTRPTHPSHETLAEIESGLAQFQDRPMLLVWGERDWCFTTEFLAEWQRRFPQAETLSLPDAGHYVFEDAPEQIVPRIREFLATHPIAEAPIPAPTGRPMQAQGEATAKRSAALGRGRKDDPKP